MPISIPKYAEPAVLASPDYSSKASIQAIKADLNAWAACADYMEQRDKAVEMIELSDARPHEKSLDLSNLGLTEMPPYLPSTVEHLDLSNNKLATVDAVPLANLKELDLSNNMLGKFDAALPDGLLRLRVIGNYLQELPSLPRTLELLEAEKYLLERANWHVQPAIDMPVSMMDSRFGEYGYTIMKEAIPSAQIRLTSDDAKTPLDEIGKQGVSFIDVADAGFSMTIEKADGTRIEVLPGDPELDEFAIAAIHGGDDDPQSLPTPIQARIVRLPQAKGAADYVTFTLNESDMFGETTLFKRFTLPFGTYRNMGGDIVGVTCEQASRLQFRFEIKGENGSLNDENNTVELRRADRHDLALIDQFNLVSAHTQEAGNVKLREQSPEIVEKVDSALSYCIEKLNDATTVYRQDPAVARALLAALVPIPPGHQRFEQILDGITSKWEKMQTLLPMLREQKLDAIGFFEDIQNDAGAYTTRNAMQLPMDYRDIKDPILLLNKLNMVAGIDSFHLAPSLLHECSHMMCGTDDSMSPDGALVYTKQHENDAELSEINMLPLMTAIALPGSVPENNACFLENFTEMCSYLAKPDTAATVMDFINASGSHRYIRIRDKYADVFKNPAEMYSYLGIPDTASDVPIAQ